MAKNSQFVIFGDQSWPVESLAKALPRKSEVSIWIDGRGWVKQSGTQNIKEKTCGSAVKALEDFTWDGKDVGEAVAIVGFQDPVLSQKIVDKLKSQQTRFKILHVGSKDRSIEFAHKRRSIAWTDLVSDGVDTEIHLLAVQERVHKLQILLKDAERIGILLQDDPDPDGLAGALALRKILNRKPQTAPIVTFGKVTRPENVAMARLLDIEVETIRESDLARFDRLVMVDCQPSFFKGKTIATDVILDHHPRHLTEAEEKVIDFIEIQEDLGSLSTLMTQMLRAADVEISQRLATALLYGIKSDTLLLNRQVSDYDLEAFVYLYPRINGNILRRIEKPELPMKYLAALRGGLDHLKVSKRGIAVLPLSAVDREEWIPQAADFALQVESAVWAVATGFFDGKVILSVRNCGYIQHCGEIVKEIFNGVGCAGGHRTMAKAIVSEAAWLEKFGPESLQPAAMVTLVKKLFNREIDRRESNSGGPSA